MPTAKPARWSRPLRCEEPAGGASGHVPPLEPRRVTFHHFCPFSAGSLTSRNSKALWGFRSDFRMLSSIVPASELESPAGAWPSLDVMLGSREPDTAS